MNTVGKIGVDFAQRGRALQITLNRPEALNALSLEMCLQIEAALDSAAAADSTELVIIRGAGGRAFCAGGDIRKVYDEGKAGRDYPYRFFKNEYRLNAKVFHFPKPYVALMDGIVMGGGVGLSVHGKWRVISDRVNFAMPETGIGLFPDVGGGHFLPRLPGQLGLYMALTGARLRAADALYAGVGDAVVESSRMDELADCLCAGDDIDETVRMFAGDIGKPALAEHRAAIDECFAADSVEAIVAALQARGDDWSAETAKTILAKSPTSLKITFRQVREGGAKSFNECMVTEYRMASGCVGGHDFYEGVRAVLVDKDHAPKWRPARLEEVSAADVAGYFDNTPPDGDIADLPADA